jgi:UDP-GlcNAc:undecaprenyl-phosphate GlcNAc-1-phosphate transferase
MISRLVDLFPAILTAIVTALVCSPLLARLARLVGLVDLPGAAPHKQHAVPTALAGGPVLAAAIAAPYLIVRSPLDNQITGILIGGLVICLWGLVDDRRSLSPLWKLLGQLIGAAVLLAIGVQVHITRIAWLDGTITLLWVVGLTNAFNLVDSMDGLALGLASIAAAFFMLATIDSVQPLLSHLAAALLGASLGAFFLNAAPARMFLGDSGAQLVGFLLAAIGIAYTPAQAGLPQGVSWFTPILVLGVPIFDTALVVVSRLRRGTPIYRAGQDHTYHRLTRLGLDPTRSVLAMQLVAVMLGLIGFIALDASVLVANVLFGGSVLLGLLALALLESRRFGAPGLPASVRPDGDAKRP